MTVMPGGDLGVWLGEELRCARLAVGYTSQDQFTRELGFDRTVIVKGHVASRGSELERQIGYGTGGRAGAER
jgi:hypothetical protein